MTRPKGAQPKKRASQPTRSDAPSAPCSAPPPPGDAPPTVVLDGANLMWGYGVALARRFGCKAYPASHGLLLALEYEARAPW